MYERQITEAEAARGGYLLSDFDGDVVEIWPENASAVQAFSAVSTQWRTGMSGATGLDYPAVFATIDRLHRTLDDEARDAIFADVQVMERAALGEMGKR